MGMPWNPMQALDNQGDHYLMRDDSTRVAIIRKVQIHQPVCELWRSTTADQNPDDRTLIGYFPSLQMAASVTWRTWIQRGKPVEQRYI